MEVLLRAGADPNLRNKGGQTPLHEAESNGHEAAANCLEATQGESARMERAIAEPPAVRSLGLTRVRTHPVRPEAVTVGSGRAVLHRGGRTLTGTWSRADRFAPFTLLADDGRVLTLAPGTTFVELAR